jgi:beta-1,4-mannosyl-glycoprotein beta-1,4-N-acetylglucosaminyltransferase
MKYAVFEQKHYYYKLNMQNDSNPFWYGSRICVKKFLKSPQWLRNLKFKKRPIWRIDKLRLNNIISNGGWHFCNLKTPEQLLYKYNNLCETNDPYVFKEKIEKKYLDIDEIEKKIFLGQDIIGRKETYSIKKLDNTFPDYIIKNIDQYRDWIST